MVQDFRTRTADHSFGVRASALIIKDGYIYLAKSPKEDYYLLGGAIHVGESTEEAIKREVLEEVGAEVSVDHLAFVVENQFCLEGVNFHQIEFHYIVSLLSDPSPSVVEGDCTRVCEWVALDDLDKIRLNPSCLKRAIKHWDRQPQHIKHIEIKE
ncbi:NUDIX domain-containing protein [Streptococcus equi subsp. zooepidemicus]|uniref:NUDIX hydrolase n=1 Tax=Streptococcus equi TaxID=1336 RepID=UPI0005B81188|nr:NUDIX domain-containing protein [Streptococcus equi]KIS09549.1 MutT/NUDIX hydrolase family protein [Streptococcus equi subsp. zooepidemicus Sz57]MCD3374779.1 NUDIX domain-containing protein [Streptococcus equi subsp. zooepidemicus]MCD3376875.1 NUDIX domain-containing protein [Streptococcus equi subsp. zooepidemicus]MCD3395493.1 NUDIX domain-containing protein [Streptococcus equi subsp. zooepidemicus]MCD3432814.1 NUDIX domain-containing protein [Streptococcus equi subsp. zooepidemicus]